MKNWFGSLSKTLRCILILAPLIAGGALLLLGVWLDRNIALIIIAVIAFAVFLFFLILNGGVEAQTKREEAAKKHEKAVSDLPQGVPVKTAEQMYEYTVAHGFGKGIVGWGKKHFKVLEKSLTLDEEAIICFVAMSDSADARAGFHAYAITNKRLLFAHKTVCGESVKSVNLENLNDVTYRTDLYHGYLEFDTLKERVSIRFPDKEEVMRLYTLVNEYFSEFKKKTNQPLAATNSLSSADELRKYKQLFDDGIITQEEYEEKKQQLLKK